VYQDFVAKYTDGSKDPKTGRIGSAFVVTMSKTEAKRLIWTVMVQRWQEQWNRDAKDRHLFRGKSVRGRL
jgi:hypothetical protein